MVKMADFRPKMDQNGPRGGKNGAPSPLLWIKTVELGLGRFKNGLPDLKNDIKHHEIAKNGPK